jgi:protocatechuate 3,4-dioxygenase beta subunit
MKSILKSAALLLIFVNLQLVVAQELKDTPNQLPSNYMERHPIYDFGEKQLSATDSVPGYKSHKQPLKITGTVFRADGQTPAKDVIVFINQTNDKGVYTVEQENDKDYILHRAWVKTDENGKYTFYTFVPGTNFGSNEIKRIHTYIKQPGSPEYEIDGFLFDNDPYLSRFCRKRLKKAGSNAILNPIKTDDILVANRDIVLFETLQASN